MVADSLMPRRLPVVISTTQINEISTRNSYSAGAAEVIAATPAAIDTATVIT